MSNPNDPNPPRPETDEDDLVGFSTPRSLQPAPPPPLPGARPDARDEPQAFPHATPAEPRPVEADPAFPAEQAFEPERSPDNFAGATRPFSRATAGAEEGLARLGGERVALAGYIGLIGAILTGGASIVITFVLAHLTRHSAEGWVRSHLDYQRLTAISGVVGVIAGLVTLPVGFGVFILPVVIVWMLVRGVFGLRPFLRRQPLKSVPFWSLP